VDGLQTYQLHTSSVTADAFEFYGVPPLLGRANPPGRWSPWSVARVCDWLQKTWKGVFNADPNVLGKNYDAVNGEATPH